MSIGVDITAPSFHRPLLVGSGARTAVIHAKLDGRFYEAAVARAISDASSTFAPEVVIVAADTVKIRYLLDSWTSNIKGSRSKSISSDEIKLTGRVFPSGGTVWVASGLVNKKTLPVRNPDHVIILDAHQQECDPQLGRRRTYIGEMPEGAHWFYQVTHHEETGFKVVRVTADEILEAYPTEADHAMSREDTLWPRKMDLKDVEVRIDTGTMETFCYARLHVKSDKPIEFLTSRQRSAAKDQLHQKQRIIPFDIHAGQRVYLEKKARILEERGGKPWVIVLKSRRIGITAIEQAISYRIASTQPYSDVATLAHKWESTQRIFSMVATFHRQDPLAIPLRTKGSRTSLQFSNGSNFFIGTAGGEGFLRGDGVARVHWSEVSKSCRGPQQMAKVEDLWSGLSGAASHGDVTLETTANGREWFYQQWVDAKAGMNELKPVFLRWFDDPLNRLQSTEFNPEEILDTLTEEETGLIKVHDLDMAQIAFRRQMKRVYKRLFPQEMPEDDKTCFISSGICFFDIDAVTQILERIESEQDGARRTHIAGGYEVTWEAPVAGRKYVVGVDTSEGIPGADRGGVAVLDKETGAQVASLHGYFRPRLLAEHAVRMARHYNDALLGVERQNHGHAVLQRVMELGRPYNLPHFRGGRLYYYVKGESLKTSREGWSTDGQTRDVMLDDLADAVSQGWMKVRDPDFAEELSTFNLQTNGKYEADPAAHDDAVMKWAIAWQMRKVHIAKPSITVL